MLKKSKPDLSARQLTQIGRLTTLFFMALSIAWVPVVASSKNLFAYLQEALAYLFPPVAAVFIAGLFWKRATGRGAFAGLVIGHSIAITCFLVTKIFDYKLLHFLEMAGVFAVISLLAIVIVSLSDSSPDTLKIEKYVWSNKRVKELTRDMRTFPWWQDYRLHSCLLLILTFWLIIANW